MILFAAQIFPQHEEAQQAFGDSKNRHDHTFAEYTLSNLSSVFLHSTDN